MEKQVSRKELDGRDINIDIVHIRGVFNRIEQSIALKAFPLARSLNIHHISEILLVPEIFKFYPLIKRFHYSLQKFTVKLKFDV